MTNPMERPAWARQNEEPIAVAGYGERLRHPDGTAYETAIYADGTVLRAPPSPSIDTLTALQVRQAIASIDFPADQPEFIADHARRSANHRATLKDGKQR